MSYKKTITATTTTWGITPSSGYKSKVVIPTVYYSNFAQIGDIIITDSDVLYNSGDEEVYSLLLADGSTFDETLYPELYAVLGSNVLENLDDVDGSPFPYKYVADFVEITEGEYQISFVSNEVWTYNASLGYGTITPDNGFITKIEISEWDGVIEGVSITTEGVDISNSLEVTIGTSTVVLPLEASSAGSYARYALDGLSIPSTIIEDEPNTMIILPIT